MTAPDGVVIVLTPNQEIRLNLHTHTHTQFGGGTRTLDLQVSGRRELYPCPPHALLWHTASILLIGILHEIIILLI